jgi:CheY-like chemotaxis protein
MTPKRILLADDNAVIRCLLRSLLDSEPGLAVCAEAIDGVEAIERAGDSQPDLIVLDLLMPRMNGWDAAATLHNLAPNIPIILFTMFKDAVPEDKARAIGIRKVVAKSGQIGGLLREVQKVLGIEQSASV